MSEFLRTCPRQVGSNLKTPGLLTTRKCKLSRHIQRLWPLFKLVGSKNSALHALCRELLFNFVIYIIAYFLKNCNYLIVQILLKLYAIYIIALFFEFILSLFDFLKFDFSFDHMYQICANNCLNALSL